MCLNPDSEYSTDLLRGAIVDFALDGSYVDFLLHGGLTAIPPPCL